MVDKTKELDLGLEPWATITHGNTTILRLGSTAYGIHPYQFGYVLGRLRKKKDKIIVQDGGAKYLSTLGQVLRTLSVTLSTQLHGPLAEDFNEALAAQGEILRIAEELDERMGAQYVLAN